MLHCVTIYSLAPPKGREKNERLTRNRVDVYKTRPTKKSRGPVHEKEREVTHFGLQHAASNMFLILRIYLIARSFDSTCRDELETIFVDATDGGGF